MICRAGSWNQGVLNAVRDFALQMETALDTLRWCECFPAQVQITLKRKTNKTSSHSKLYNSLGFSRKTCWSRKEIWWIAPTLAQQEDAEPGLLFTTVSGQSSNINFICLLSSTRWTLVNCWTLEAFNRLWRSWALCQNEAVKSLGFDRTRTCGTPRPAKWNFSFPISNVPQRRSAVTPGL